MRILHIIPSYLPARIASGPIKPTHYLNKELVKKGIDVTVYTTNMDGSKKLDVLIGKEVDIDGVKVFYFSTSFPRVWQYSRGLHRVLAKNINNFDIIHITSVFLSVSTLGAYYAKKFRIPYIISPHGSLMKKPIKHNSFKKKVYITLLEKRNLIGAAAIHFTIKREKDDYLKAGLPLTKAVIIPNGLDIKEFEKRSSTGFKDRYGIAHTKKIILFLGRLHWIKGFDTLIPAFAKVIKKESKAVLVLAGPNDEDYKKEIEKLIEKYEINRNKIVFTGMILGAEKISVLQDSDVFVLPSYSENFGMAVIEAMYFGLPVVVTEGVGISPSIARAGAGLVIKKDEKELTNAILEILNNPDMAKKMGDSGKRVVETEFSLAGIVEKWVETYNSLISK